jgi:Cytochrome P460
MSLRSRLATLAPMLLIMTGATNETADRRFTNDGSFITPTDFREWVFLSSAIDMSYTENEAMQGHSMFDNVFVDPAAWKEFKRSGHWPDKTVFALETRGANSKGSINKTGQYQTEQLMGVEFHVHDASRFTGGWGFFAAEGAKPATLIAYSAQCYSCHLAHGAVDTTFTQFYPTAKPIAVKAGSFREE